VLTDLDIYTGFIPTKLMTNTSGCYYTFSPITNTKKIWQNKTTTRTVTYKWITRSNVFLFLNSFLKIIFLLSIIPKLGHAVIWVRISVRCNTQTRSTRSSREKILPLIHCRFARGDILNEKTSVNSFPGKAETQRRGGGLKTLWSIYLLHC